MNGTLWKIDRNGDRIGQYVSWPELTLPKANFWLSFQDTVYNSTYPKPGFMMPLGTAKAEVKQTANAGTYSISIQGDTVADVYNLRILVYRKLGFEEVAIFPPVVLLATSFLGRLWWLVTGRLPENKRQEKVELLEKHQVKGPLPKVFVLADNDALEPAAIDEQRFTWVRLGDLANYLGVKPETLWKKHFQTWHAEGTALVIVALKIGENLFMGGIDQKGRKNSLEFLLGNEQAFLDALGDVYISAEKAFQLMKQ